MSGDKLINKQLIPNLCIRHASSASASDAPAAASSNHIKDAPRCTELWFDLQTLLEGCNLAEKLPDGIKWCQEMGVDTLAELMEVEMEPELVAALELKPVKGKLLLKRLKEKLDFSSI
jgi:hypothetical protein